jgi:type II restriction/modification system DNA methylase subunit YeeA
MSASLTPAAFIAKWQASTLGEDRNGGAARQHFLDVCELVGAKKPADADPKGEWYCFERGAARTSDGTKAMTRGWADVWMRGHFGWEYKGPGADLEKAYGQLKSYADALENPPLLVVSDTKRIVIRTNFTNTVTATHTIELADLADPNKLELLRWVFTDPARLKPSKTIQAVTEEAATKFGKLALQLHGRGHNPEAVAHFVNRLAFCMFAEDVNLLPKGFFTERLYTLVNHPERATQALKTLFGAMSKGGMYGDEPIAWFNGGLFDNDVVLPLEREDLALLHSAASMDWQDIDPSIFGTLFERGLDPAKRSQLGAHYTDAVKIEMIIDPVIRQPLLREWAAVKAEIEAETKRKTTRKADATKSQAKAVGLRDAFVSRLRDYRVLDPACGSGNFLYLALKTLKSIEHLVYLECEAFGMLRPIFMETGPHNMLGIELNSYAAELARMTVWIGEIQWCLQHGWQIKKDPVLQSLRTIQHHDALLNDDGTEFKWPKADAIVGNPPFLGGKKMKPELGEDATEAIRRVFKGRLPAFADLVCYWFEKAHQQMKQGKVQRVGLVSTNSISGGKNREVLQTIAANHHLYQAWADEPWTVEGAAVRVAIVCFAPKGQEPVTTLDGVAVAEIYPDLKPRTTGGTEGNIIGAQRLPSNAGVAFIGLQPSGPFSIEGELARRWLKLPSNPNGRPNADVVHPYWNGMDATRRPSDTWVIDTGVAMTEREAAMYEAPFAHLMQVVKPVRDASTLANARKFWWRHWCTRPEMREALHPLHRYVATPRNGKHRIFLWMPKAILPDCQMVAIARDDDVIFGILHSRFHELWALRMGTFLGKGNDPRYTPSTTFETFPFPQGLEPNRAPADYTNPHAEAIATAARNLNDLRERWLNPPEWVDRVPEVVAGYPDRIVPKNPEAAEQLKHRTLTKLYNERGTGKMAWLDHAHADLDTAVAAAYGWPVGMSDDEILSRLLSLNIG